jgi:hypothetical protein
MLRISLSLYEALRAHGEATYPHECCGVLLGQMDDDTRTVTSIEHARNTRTDSAHNRYNIDPKDPNSAHWTRARGRYCWFLPLASRPSGPVVDDGLRRSSLDWLLLRDKRRGKRKDRNYQLLRPDRPRRKRQEIRRRKNRSRLTPSIVVNHPCRDVAPQRLGSARAAARRSKAASLPEHTDTNYACAACRKSAARAQLCRHPQELYPALA